MTRAERRRARRLAGAAVSILAVVLLAAVTGSWLSVDAEVVAPAKGLRVDGRAFFPVGLYWAPMAKFAQLRDMGFNVVHLWAAGAEGTRRELDEAQRLGMRAVIELSEYVRDPRLQAPALRTFVEAVRTHPAVLAWYLVDEPSPDAIARIEHGYRLLRSVDPGRPVLIVHYTADVSKRVAPYLDILGVDSYPVPNQPLAAFSNQLKRVRSAAGMEKPLWAVVQAFNKEVDKRPTRYPTPGEMRNMVYQGIAAGATGVLYFSYAWQGTLEEKDPVLWAAFGPINRELATLTPVLLEGRGAPRGVRVSAPTDVRTVIRQWDGRVYVILVNVRPLPTQIEIYRQGGGGGHVEGLFDVRGGKMRDGVFTDTLEAHGIRVYRL